MLHFSTVKTENHRNGIPPMVPPVGPLGWLRSGGLCPSSRTLPSASSGLLLNLPCAFPVQLPCASAPRLLFGTPVQLLPLCGSSHRAHPFMPRLVSGEPLYGHCFELYQVNCASPLHYMHFLFSLKRAPPLPHCALLSCLLLSLPATGFQADWKPLEQQLLEEADMYGPLEPRPYSLLVSRPAIRGVSCATAAKLGVPDECRRCLTEGTSRLL